MNASPMALAPAALGKSLVSVCMSFPNSSDDPTLRGGNAIEIAAYIAHYLRLDLGDKALKQFGRGLTIPTATFVVDIITIPPYAAPAYLTQLQEAAHITSLSDRK
jgi:hypothetical protein